MSYLEELLPEFRKGAKIRQNEWLSGEYVCYKNGRIYNQDNTLVDLFICLRNLQDDWELYKEPIDWDYIIKNKCLCWFWNNDETDIDILKHKYTDGFLDDYGRLWENCRPVRRDEVTFYEDKKDEI